MKKYLVNLFRNDKFELIDLGSARQVLYSLDNNEIDIGVIGRQAKKHSLKVF